MPAPSDFPSNPPIGYIYQDPLTCAKYEWDGEKWVSSCCVNKNK